jgi:hypothetical protein
MDCCHKIAIEDALESLVHAASPSREAMNDSDEDLAFISWTFHMKMGL